MSVENNKAIVCQFLEDVWGNGNLQLIPNLVSPNHVHHLSTRDIYGPEEVEKLVLWFRAFLPDVQITIQDLIGEGDKIVAYFNFSGTDKGGYMKQPPSGKQVSYNGIDIFRISQGKIVERWGIVDTASLLYQLEILS